MISPTSNHPDNWKALFPWPQDHYNKYDRGSVFVVAAKPEMAGAAKMCAKSALRIGAGLATIACEKQHLVYYASSALSVMTRSFENNQELYSYFHNPKYTTLVLGPGMGVSEQTKEHVLHALATAKPVMLDADALSSFQTKPSQLFDAMKGPTILSPHEGEFKRLFTLTQDRVISALTAATQSHAVIILKGHDTIIASPDGHVVINHSAPAWLATAGSGDVLSGICSGLLANHVDPFIAACIGVWIHSECAHKIGPGLIAEDLIEAIPAVLVDL
ncbi:MAG: NAD(P)H-hydrate dehydratase [Alphaproteobacteria bacterium]|nr:NAD(P)H-hydrate dehydratase [Alphaproteobacteria bacterium]